MRLVQLIEPIWELFPRAQLIGDFLLVNWKKKILSLIIHVFSY